MAKYKVEINREACISCNSAPSLCPKVFYLDPTDYKNRVQREYEVSFDGKTSTGIIPEELYECAKTGADSCPVGAIRVERIE